MSITDLLKLACIVMASINALIAMGLYAKGEYAKAAYWAAFAAFLAPR